MDSVEVEGGGADSVGGGDEVVVEVGGGGSLEGGGVDVVVEVDPPAPSAIHQPPLSLIQ